MKMKKYGFVLALSLALSPLFATAQGLDASSGVKVNAGVGGVNADLKANATATANQSKNDDKSGEGGNAVSASAREVRGWSDDEKKDFLLTVKAHAQLKSEQDLNNFAKGVMLKDNNVRAVETDDDSVEVSYKLPAKFLGVFSADLSAIANVTFEQEKTGRGPKEVTVRFPWYRMFFSLSAEVREEVLETAIDSAVKIRAQVPRDNVQAQNGVTVQIISEILKAIRAKLEVSTTTRAFM